MAQVHAASALATLQANVARTVTRPRPNRSVPTGDERITLAERARVREERDRVLRSLPYLVPEYMGLGIVSRETLEGDMASCEIFKEQVPKATDAIKDVYGTLMDTMMGSTDRQTRCAQCSGVGDNCPGHPGKILFKRTVCNQLVPNPVYHPSYVKRTVLLLQCICAQCGSLVLRDVLKAKRLLKGDFEKRVKLIAKESIDQECTACGASANPTYKLSKADPNVIVKQYHKDGAISPVYPMEAYKILASISDEDAKILGYGARFGWANRPKDLIAFGIMVTPPRVRRVTYRNNVPEEDDFTKHYVNIIKRSNAIRRYVPDPNYTPAQVEQAYFDLSRDLMNAQRDMIEGTSGGLNQTETLLSFKDVLNGKEGLFRGMLNGKPVDFSARSVAGPGADLDVDEVGVPLSFASELTYPELIFRTQDITGKIVSNLEQMTEKLREGQVKWIQRQDGQRIRVTERNRDTEQLRIGDTVARFLQDGDMIFVNRNPSLHAPSFMALRVRLMPVETITINMGLTLGFNADFDGDELNLHFPQDLMARAEMITLADPKHCLLSTAKGGVLVAAVIDGLVGSYLLTRRGVQIESETWQDGFSVLRRQPYNLGEFLQRCKRYNRNPYLGRSLFSVLLPATMSFRSKLKEKQIWRLRNPEDNTVRIVEETELVIENGLLISGAVTDKHIAAQGVLGNYLIHQYGADFYVGFLSDLERLVNWYLAYEGFTVSLDDCANLGSASEEQTKLRQLQNQAFERARSYGSRKSNAAEEERRQENYLNALDSVKEGAILTFKGKFENSNLAVLANSGAKGSSANYFMMRGSLGPQTIRGQMLPKGLGEGPNARLTPFFPPGSDDPRAHGFAESNFGTGLTPRDYVYHMMETRATQAQGKNAAESGYLQRKLAKLLEDVFHANDGTTRKVRTNYTGGVSGSRTGDIIQFVTHEIRVDPAQLMMFNDEYGQFFSYIDMANVVNEFNQRFGSEPPRVLTPEELADLIDVFNVNLSVFPASNEAAIRGHKAILTRQLTTNGGLKVRPDILPQLKAEIHRAVVQATHHAGAPVGIITATNLGQVTTQDLLKLKGKVGTGSSRVLTNQVAQTMTLLNVPEEAKGRTSFVYFDPPLTFRQVHNRIKEFEFMLVGSLVTDPDVFAAGTVDRSWYPSYVRHFAPNRTGTALAMPDDHASVLRLTLNKQLLVNYGISVADVAAALEPLQPLMFVSPNHLGVIDIYRGSGGVVGTSERDYYFLRNIILPQVLQLTLGGIPGIDAAFPSFVSLTSLIQSQREVTKGTWRLFRNTTVERQHPLKLQNLIPLLVENGFRVTEETPKYLTVTLNGEATPGSQPSPGPQAALQTASQIPANFDRYNLSYMETAGTNLARILLVPGVDQDTTYSNHPKEMEGILGVAAAEEMFIPEFGQSLGSVIPVHVTLLADFMHAPGRPTGINRSGASQQAKGVTSLASFEQAHQNVMAHAPSNPLEVMGVNPSVMMGQMVSLGTGYSDILTPANYADELERLQQLVARGETPYPARVESSVDEELANIDVFSGGAAVATLPTASMLPPIPSSIFTGMPSMTSAPAAPPQRTTIIPNPPTGVNAFPQPVPITTPRIIPTNLPKSLLVTPPSGTLSAMLRPAALPTEGVLQRPILPPNTVPTPLGTQVSTQLGAQPTVVTAATAPAPGAQVTLVTPGRLPNGLMASVRAPPRTTLALGGSLLGPQPPSTVPQPASSLINRRVR